jgi:hypothetical protein
VFPSDYTANSTNMRSTLLLALAAVVSSVLAYPGRSDYGSSKGDSYSGSGYGSIDGSSLSGDSSPSYGGDNSHSKSRNYYESKSYSKSDRSNETKTHGSHSEETGASKTYGYVWETHSSKSHTSDSKETHRAKSDKNSTKIECYTHTKTYTVIETASNGGYVGIQVLHQSHVSLLIWYTGHYYQCFVQHRNSESCEIRRIFHLHKHSSYSYNHDLSPTSQQYQHRNTGS